MKRILLLVLAGGLFVSGCNDQIDGPQDSTTSEKIVYSIVDYSVQNMFPDAVVADSDGTNKRTLGKGYIFAAGKSRMLWASGSSEDDYELVVSDAIGGNRIVLKLESVLEPSEELYAFGEAISPDGSKVTYSVRDTSGKYRLYIINANGSDKRLLSDTYFRETCVAFSPDGKQIAYYRKFDDQHQLDQTIEISNTDGTNRYTVTAIDNPGVDGYGRIAWSTKNRIAFTDDGKLYTINADGAEKAIVADRGEAPAWSPTGDTLAFAQDGGDGDIKITTDNGLTYMNLTNTPGIWESYPSWSADGKRMLITRWIGDFDQTLLTLEEIDVATATKKLIASPGAFGFYVKY